MLSFDDDVIATPPPPGILVRPPVGPGLQLHNVGRDFGRVVAHPEAGMRAIGAMAPLNAPNPAVGHDVHLSHDLDVTEPRGMPPYAQRFARVKVEDKRVINGQADVNQLVPFKYKWAWEKYLAGCAN